MPSPYRRARAIAAVETQRGPAPWQVAAATVMTLLAAGAAHGQAQAPASPAVPPVDAPNTVVPEVIAPTIPPGAGGSGATMPQPRSENPLSPTPSTPVPDAGILVAPPSDAGQTPVIRPPAGVTNTPVIPPPGSPGGSGLVVPR